MISHRRSGRVIGRAVIQEDGAAEEVIAQDRPRAHHPADVGEPEEEVVVAMVEAEPDLLADLRQASGVGVHGALRFAGGARGVQDQAGRLRGHWLRFAKIGLTRRKFLDVQNDSFDSGRFPRRHPNGLSQVEPLAAALQSLGRETLSVHRNPPGA